jgi:protein associated with RNAse G/E
MVTFGFVLYAYQLGGGLLRTFSETSVIENDDATHFGGAALTQ